MNITEYRKELDEIILGSPDIVAPVPPPEYSNDVEGLMAASVQAQLLKEIALCIAENTKELSKIRYELGRIAANKQ